MSMSFEVPKFVVKIFFKIHQTIKFYMLPSLRNSFLTKVGTYSFNTLFEFTLNSVLFLKNLPKQEKQVIE